jgi:hypothetical protein
MRQIRINKRGTRPASWQELPLDARDPDIAHAHQLARRDGSRDADRGGPGGRGRN